MAQHLQTMNNWRKSVKHNINQSNSMEHSFFSSHRDPKEGGQSDEETFEFDPNEESLSEGSEFADDSLRMVEQPFHQKSNS